MRISVDIPDGQLDVLAAIGRRERRSRAAVIREAISSYIERRDCEKRADAFGLWGKRRVGGVAYQGKIRDG